MADSDKGINKQRLQAIVDVIADLKKQVPNISIVSSGAIAAGFKLLGFKKRPKEINEKQACASVGQAKLMWHYDHAFKKHNMHVAQILITKYDFSDREHYLNACETIKCLHKLGATPIINENDTVIANELKYVESFGDNDNLSALVAGLIDADMLLILSDVNGLYTADPNSNPDAKFLYDVPEITDEVIELAGGSTSGVGTGGMASKLTAAVKSVNAGCPVAILNGKDPENIKRFLAGGDVGTYFHANDDIKTAKKRWLLDAAIPQGTVYINAGALRALTRHSSLLATGVTRVEGAFTAGNIVNIAIDDDECVAVGKVRYDSAVLNKIKSKNSSEISEILKRDEPAIVVHYDEMGII